MPPSLRPLRALLPVSLRHSFPIVPTQKLFSDVQRLSEPLLPADVIYAEIYAELINRALVFTSSWGGGSNVVTP